MIFNIQTSQQCSMKAKPSAASSTPTSPVCRRPRTPSLHVCLFWVFCFLTWPARFWKQMLVYSWGTSRGTLFHPLAKAVPTIKELLAVRQVFQGMRIWVQRCHLQYRKAVTQSGKRPGEEETLFLCVCPVSSSFWNFIFKSSCSWAACYTPITS